LQAIFNPYLEGKQNDIVRQIRFPDWQATEGGKRGQPTRSPQGLIA
jgi:hypothetical protein